MTVVIVDDEKLAIEELVFQLSLCEDVHILATFMDPDIAEEFILNNHVDLVFLDIQMPGNNGIKFAKKLFDRKNIHIIFVTAHTEYAVHSYEINATDYLLKPISNTRLMKALDKVHQRKKQMQIDQNIKPFIVINESGVLKPIQFSDIVYCRANDKYVDLFTRQKRYQYDGTISRLQELLNANDFFRCHRSYIINLNHIAVIEPVERTFLIQMTGMTELIPVSRSNTSTFKEKMSI